jgi:hypothetical protein
MNVSHITSAYGIFYFYHGKIVIYLQELFFLVLEKDAGPAPKIYVHEDHKGQSITSYKRMEERSTNKRRKESYEIYQRNDNSQFVQLSLYDIVCLLCLHSMSYWGGTCCENE